MRKPSGINVSKLIQTSFGCSTATVIMLWGIIKISADSSLAKKDTSTTHFSQQREFDSSC